MKNTKRSFNAALLSVLLATAINITGCSWIFMDRAPADPETPDLIDCSGIGWPVVDTIFAIGSLVYTGLQFNAAANHDPDGNSIYSGFSKEALIATGITNLVMALVHGSSAVTGFCWADTCREAKQKRIQWLKTRYPRTRMEQLDKSIEKAKQVPKQDQ